ncbi:unnamed protein product [Owenia fusiformis]|uniref:Guanylate cyclase n=1 Tax=Owenia fusiformis TaxID=6347 RepID=A0A8S4P318_OWEFU|nr:unnamed protein product [Owenia fusiformis]
MVSTWLLSCVMIPFTAIWGREFKILILLPRTNTHWKYSFGTEMSGVAALEAIDFANANILTGNNSLTADFADTRCDQIQGLGIVVDKLTSTNYSAIVGPPCSPVCKHVGRLAAYKNIPMFNGVCQGIEMLNKNVFSTLTRFLGTFDLVGGAVVSFLKTYKWKRVSIIAQKHADPIWTLTRDAVGVLAEKNNISVAAKETLDLIPRTTHLSQFQTAVNTSRIVNRVYGDFTWQQGSPRDEDLLKAFSAVFWLNYFEPPTAQYKDFQERVIKRSKTEFNFTYESDENVPYQAANLYEAVYLYAVSLNNTLEEGGDPDDGRLVSQRLWGKSFSGIAGNISLNSNGDRNQGYTVKKMKDVESAQIEVVGHYFSIKGVYEPDTNVSIHWPGGRSEQPSDGPACGWENELCPETSQDLMQTLIISVVIVVFSLVLVGSLVVLLIYRKLKWSRDIAEMRWKCNYDDVKMHASGTESRMSRISLNTKGSYGRGDDVRFTEMGLYKGATVAIKRLLSENVILNEKYMSEMKQIYDLSHNNIAKIIGVCVDGKDKCILTEYCAKGSLQDVLWNEDLKLDSTFKFSLMLDVIEGLRYLQNSFRKCHGNLKSSNCLVDTRFVVKLSDFGLVDWRKKQEVKNEDILYKSPEELFEERPAFINKKASDVYSFGILAQEIVNRRGTWYLKTEIDVEEILKLLKNPMTCHKIRPDFDEDVCSESLQDIIRRCWSHTIEKRPTVDELSVDIKNTAYKGKKGLNIMDNLLNRMEQYANNLESLIEERTGQYLDEKKRVEDLLHRLLPRSVAKQLQTKGFVEPESYDCVSIYFSDIVGFTSISASSTPFEIVNFLNDLYTAFDAIIDGFDVYKVETIGDAYMVVSGLPNRISNHAQEICHMAIALLNIAKTFEIKHKADERLKLRIGIHTGSVVVGVVGLKMPRYCLFGDTVNTASRMESNGEAMKIHISSDTQKQCNTDSMFIITLRGELMIKGKGMMTTYWLQQSDSYNFSNLTLKDGSFLTIPSAETQRSPGRQNIDGSEIHGIKPSSPFDKPPTKLMCTRH